MLCSVRNFSISCLSLAIGLQLAAPAFAIPPDIASRAGRHVRRAAEERNALRQEAEATEEAEEIPTDAEVLEKLAEDPAIENPIPKLIVEHRELSKLVNTYLEALAEAIYPEGVEGAHRIHSSFSQTVAVTGRLASSDPNLQNIPIRTDVGREIRRAFIASEGNVLISADYSQIELRLLAHLSRDAALIKAFHEGQDIHTAVAAQIHNVKLDQVTREQRNGAKMVNFGIVYGVTPFGLGRRLGVSNSAAEEIITGYKRRFPGITTFLQECVEQAKSHGYVQTMLGRRRPIPEIESPIPARRAFAERTAINSVVQGSAADLIKLAMVDVYAALPITASLASAKLLLQIHDELVFECAAADIEKLFFAFHRLHPHLARLEEREQRCVPRSDAKLALGRRQEHHLRRARINLALGADDVDLYGAGHYCSVLAFSTTSSIEPTM